MKILYSLLIVVAAALCSSAQGGDPPPPVQVPQPVCNGCSAQVTITAPESASLDDPIGGSCEDFPITYTFRREIAIRGNCDMVNGHCTTVKRCAAIGMLVGSYSAWGSTTTINLQAETRICGGFEEDSMTVSDAICGGEDASVEAKCTECFQ